MLGYLPAVLDLPLLGLLDRIDHGLPRLILGFAFEAMRQVDRKDPDAKAFKVRVLLNP
jgi:hypothetical protein